MPRLVWDQTGEKLFETGIEEVALYPQVAGAYPKGVAWNGVTALNITPSGAEPTPLYANNKKYLTLMSNEEVGGTIEAYMYPDEWAACDGSRAVADGVYIGQQPRQAFGLVGKSRIGNDTEGITHGYKLHILYGCLASPAEQANATINESIEAKAMSWEFSTTPVTDFTDDSGDRVNLSVAYICVDSTKVDAAKLTALEEALYGSKVGENAEARLPMPAEIFSILGANILEG